VCVPYPDPEVRLAPNLSDAGNEPISLASLIVSGVTTASRSAKVLIDLHASHT
jgi:hypothetical protein